MAEDTSSEGFGSPNSATRRKFSREEALEAKLRRTQDELTKALKEVEMLKDVAVGRSDPRPRRTVTMARFPGELSADPHYKDLFERNKAWVASKTAADPTYFKSLASKSQTPTYLFIGCSDSRVPSSTILQAEPGEVFVHRNVANLVVGSDLNCLTVITYAVEVLKVKHIMVVGHYGCGGVKAAMEARDAGVIENWLRAVRDAQRLNNDELITITDPEEKYRRVVELNVKEQCLNVLKLGVVQRARKQCQESTGHLFPEVHGLVYDLAEGVLRELDIDFAHYAKKFGHVFTLS